jgi:hypothetical protein
MNGRIESAESSGEEARDEKAFNTKLKSIFETFII